MKKQTLGSIYKKENIAEADWYISFKQQVSLATDIPVLDMSEVLCSTVLTDIIICFFQNSEN